MHFEKIPPFLLKLTFIEQLLIRKITVALYIHTLKYGILASKGHAVSVPQNLNIYTKLPLLPDEVGLLVLRTKGRKSKRYIASCIKVQAALEGLIFGFPKFGLIHPVDGYSQYNGKDHISGIALKGKFFLYPPNPFYFDVSICQERLDTISKDSEVYDMPSIDLQSNEDNNEIEDLGPAQDQFEILSKDEEIGSWSGIVAPSEVKDADEGLKKILKKFS